LFKNQTLFTILNPTEHEQKTIESWFNKTYASRGESYLRPKQAYIIFAELLDLQPQKTILDIACGLGRMLEISATYKTINYGIDISKVAVQKAKLKLPNDIILQGNAEQLPFENSLFDYVTCLGSLERMIDKETVLQEINRVTKPEAKICIMVRNTNSWRWVFTKKMLLSVNKKGHQDAKTYQEWKTLFEQHNFVIENCVADQWPIMKLKKIASFGIFKNYKKVSKTIMSIDFANEFIFILKKKS
jgi:ubiquinone/menaquinone biosynthesis C-methylase UbiE